MTPGDESIINHILRANPEEVKQTIDDIKQTREQASNKHVSFASDSMQLGGKIPARVYWHMAAKYGKAWWDDPKNQRQFWDTFSVFKVAEGFAPRSS